MAASWKLTLGLFLILSGYLLFGGWLFRVLEKDEEAAYRRRINLLYNSLKITQMNDLEYSENATEVKWDYDGALFFSFTVVSTIGYGNLAPATRFGRIAFIFYGLIGIPLFLAFLSCVAEYSKDLHERLRSKQKTRHHFYSFMFYAVSALLLFFVPSAVIAHVEGWSYIDSMYFAFQTLTTVGFGDLVPGITRNTFPKAYRIFIIVWVIIGLAYTSALISFLFNFDMQFFQALTRCKRGKSDETKTQVVQTTQNETWQEFQTNGSERSR